MSSVEEQTAATPPEPVVEAPKLSPEERVARQRHRFGLAAAGGAVMLAASAFAAIVVQAHVAEAERADPFTPKPVVVRKVAPVTASAAVPPAIEVAADAEDAEAPDINDPRWARATTALAEPVRVKPAAHGASAFAAIEQIRRGIDEPENPDEVETAAISPRETKPEPAAEPEPKATRNATTDRPAQSMATVMADVRLRAGPSDRSAVLGVVKSGTDVGVVDCDGWCEVIAAGKRGYVYKRFVGKAKATVKRQTAKDGEGSGTAPAGPESIANDVNDIGR